MHKILILLATSMGLISIAWAQEAQVTIASTQEGQEFTVPLAVAKAFKTLALQIDLETPEQHLDAHIPAPELKLLLDMALYMYVTRSYGICETRLENDSRTYIWCGSVPLRVHLADTILRAFKELCQKQWLALLIAANYLDNSNICYICAVRLMSYFGDPCLAESPAEQLVLKRRYYIDNATKERLYTKAQTLIKTA